MESESVKLTKTDENDGQHAYNLREILFLVVLYSIMSIDNNKILYIQNFQENKFQIHPKKIFEIMNILIARFNYSVLFHKS